MCEYCNGKHSLTHAMGDYWIHIEGSNMNLKIESHKGDFWDKNRFDQIKINYCPMCGRKLNEEV